MKGDFTRLPLVPSKGYAQVLKQQGRVDLDADWNEAAAIQAYLDRTRAKDLIGLCGVPKKNAGFLVGTVGNGADLTLSSGRIYVDGLLCETKWATYRRQPYLPNPPALEFDPGKTDLVYLDVWQRHITAVEDPDLLEVALGGADTTTRLQTVWQVKVRHDVEETECDGKFAPWPPVPPLDQRGTLTTGTVVVPDAEDPCLIAPGGGYHGLENRLYRVEIHDGGQPYAWPRPAGAAAADVTDIANGSQVTVANLEVEGRPWRVGQMVELYSDETNASGQAGKLTRITAIDAGNSKVTLEADLSSMTGHNNRKLRRVATFKWSRDNGSVVYGIDGFVAGQPTKVRVKSLGRDQVLALQANDWVEVLGDETELKGLPGTLTAIAPGGIDEAERILTLATSVAHHDGEEAPKVRRWDQKGAALAVTTEPLTLEDGIQIQFGGQNYQTGDYWTFAARTPTGTVDELRNAPPQGIAHHYCRLALITWGASARVRFLILLRDGGPVPDLAESWEFSEDDGAWIFRLVEDVTLPGGAPFTAEVAAEILIEMGLEAKAIDDFTLAIFGDGERLLRRLVEIPLVEGEGLETHVEDCRPDFPTLTEICAEDVCYDNRECDAIQAETVQEALDQLCAMRDLRHHNKHLHGWGIVCGLQVRCGADDPELAGDRTTVTVRPGYAIDCEGNDIVLDEAMTVSVMEMIEEWERTQPERRRFLREGENRLCLIIERDEHGQPRVALRPYDPADDRLKAMLQGTLLMDFIQDCILEPLKAIRDILIPDVDSDKEVLVGPERRQFITMLNLLVQVWNPEHGSHVYLSPKEHEILKNLYFALRAVLQSKTFCAMFDDARQFPEYPFKAAKMSTIFDRGLRTRLRIHPNVRFGLGLGLDEKIHVYNLEDEELVAVLEMPGGAGLVVQDVAFSEDGQQLYAIGTVHDKDSVFVMAEIRGLEVRWQPVTLLCGAQLLTLARVPGFDKILFAVGRGDGLYTINFEEAEPKIELRVGFKAVGHLVADGEAGRAYASAANPDAQPTAYDRVVEIDLHNLDAGVLVTHHLQAGESTLTGTDDIAIAPDLDRLYAVADVGENGEEKALFIFKPGDPEWRNGVPLPSTTIRLGYVPGSQFLMVTAEDHYSVYLVWGLAEPQYVTWSLGGQFISVHQVPVQIAPLAIAVGPKGEWVYVANSLSPTVTKISAEHMQPTEFGEDQEPPPGSDQFLEELIQYRRDIFMAFTDLVGGLVQYLKDCFCDHLLVNCPECSPDDEVYLASVTVRAGEVYKVCNFSRRKYVKSFPTVGYWLSLIPISPFIHKAVEYLCCLVLPEFFGRFQPPKRDAYQPPMKSSEIRTGYVAYQQLDPKREWNKVVERANLAQKVVGDWVISPVTKPRIPVEETVQVESERFVDQPVEEAVQIAQEAEIATKVVKYNPAEGAKNLIRVAQAPRNVPTGSEVTFYEENGVVRYYTVSEKAPAPVEAIQTELEAQKAELAEVKALKTTVGELQGTLAQKDQELAALRSQVQALAQKQTELEADPALAKVATMEAELEELRTFKGEVERFMNQ